MTPGLTWLLATACGLIVAKVYYAQPLIALITPDIGLHATAASLIVIVTQIGYCAGLVLLVPLGDRVENRRLVVLLAAGSMVALTVAAVARSAAAFLGASLGIGLMSVAIQVMVPIAGAMAAPEVLGRVVGNVLPGGHGTGGGPGQAATARQRFGAGLALARRGARVTACAASSSRARRRRCPGPGGGSGCAAAPW